MKVKNTKITKRKRLHAKIRTRVFGTAEKPRLSVFRSNTYIYAQVINDTTNTTLASADSRTMKGKKVEVASKVGAEIAKNAIAKKINTVVFDRGGFNYAGRVQALADGARKGGLVF